MNKDIVNLIADCVAFVALVGIVFAACALCAPNQTNPDAETVSILEEVVK